MTAGEEEILDVGGRDFLKEGERYGDDLLVDLKTRRKFCQKDTNRF
jgi:hypothetical protein